MKAFQKQEAVLFQFILQELLILGRELKTLQVFKNELTPPERAIVLKKLYHLTGTSQHPIPLFSKVTEKGVIPKLKLLIKTLIHDWKRDSQYFLTLLETVLRIEKKLISLIEETQPSSSLNRYLSEIEKCLKQMTPFFKESETVLYFYLRKKTIFDTIFSRGFVATLFKEGGKEFEVTLISGFKKRGFFTLIPSIEKELALLGKDQ